MINKTTFDFLEQLKQNNYREWFHENKVIYDAARSDVTSMLGQVIERVSLFDKTISYADPKKCLFRIARDTRFSKNKDPYKSNFGAIINADGRTSSSLSGYYIHIEPGACMVSCGVYMPMSPILKAIREAIDIDWEEFSQIISEKEFKEKAGDLSFEDKILKRVPRGYSPDFVGEKYLRLTSFYVIKHVEDSMVLSSDFVDYATDYFKAVKPFNDFMNKTIRNNGL